MKTSSPHRKPVSRATARNAALVNQLATPGLGSLMARRWFAGGAQLILATAGFTLIMVWFGKEMIRLYNLQYFDKPLSDAPAPSINWIWQTGLILFVAAWLWSAWTSYRLVREASGSTLQSLQNFTAPPMLKLAPEKIAAALALMPNWERRGDVILRTFQFKDFPAAVKFVDAAAMLAEQAWHHPDIDIRWNKVTLTLTTHDAGGLTAKDFSLARQLDQL
jgi:4a-hydroxytetrahydrobiopterin dehydratase